MKDELNAKMVEILTSIQTAAGKASDFALEQLPDIAQSYVLYGRAYITFLFAFLLALSLLSAYGSWKAWKSISEDPIDAEGFVFIMVISGLASGISLFFAMINTSQLFLVWFAPKVWLLKELARLIR